MFEKREGDRVSKSSYEDDLKSNKIGSSGFKKIIKLNKYNLIWVIIIIVAIFLSYFFMPLFVIFEKKVCGDGTPYGECSGTAPYFCLKGILVQDASFCKCPVGFEQNGDSCEYELQTLPKVVSLDYFFKGEPKKIDFIVYHGMVTYLSEHPQSSFYSLGDNYSLQDFKLRVIGEPEQKKLLLPLVIAIQNTAKNKEDQARIAISLVQNIPYEKSAVFDKENYKLWSLKYPYDVLYQKEGLCGSKSDLLAFLLKEIGYEVVIFHYYAENHEAIGIKCPKKNSLNNTGYCFVESTQPAIISYSEGQYSEKGELSSNPEIIKISNGTSLGWSLEEYRDADTLYGIQVAPEKNNGNINLVEYFTRNKLVKKYGLASYF